MSVLHSSAVPLFPPTPPPTRSPAAAGGAAGGTGGAAGGAAAPALGWTTITGFVMQSQEQQNWCWAAVACSTAELFGQLTWTQCKLVEAELDEDTCCQDGSTDECDKPWYLDDALRRTGNLEAFTSGATAFASVRDEVDAGLPLGVRIRWEDGGGHFVALDGYLDGDDPQVQVRDPWDGLHQFDYEEFRDRYDGNGEWTHSYRTKG